MHICKHKEDEPEDERMTGTLNVAKSERKKKVHKDLMNVALWHLS